MNSTPEWFEFVYVVALSCLTVWLWKYAAVFRKKWTDDE